MSSYRDPTLRGDVHPSEEEIDPTGIGPLPSSAPPGPAYRDDTEPAPVPGPPPAPVPAPSPTPPPGPPGPPPRAGAARPGG
ncbi:hypothetical protein [Micromonospora rosaria]|uniref:hypothetical protein n=1 Tax=Micromonospora rosaria TaxID=47874 RepID=UPI001B802CB9|nr:hypothetical protein [Micromonospora rosaria]